jgi:diadenosine tetraphosphate (Ap4A) HIT family hydrolase
MTATCTLCAEFADPAAGLFAAIYEPDAPSRVLREDGDVLVIPTIGQITACHLLVLPRQHKTSFASMGAGQLERADRLVESVRTALEATGSRCVVFEHGLGAHPGQGGCGVSHAHLHVVAVPRRLAALDPPAALNWTPHIGGLSALSSHAGNSYLYFCDQVGTSWIAHVTDLPSQFMRRWLAMELGETKWDWTRAGHEEALVSKLAPLSGLLLDPAPRLGGLG